MIDDFNGGQAARRKRRQIQPLGKAAVKLLPNLDEEIDAEPGFQPPEVVAATNSNEAPVMKDDASSAVAKVLSKRKPRFSSWSWPLNKKWTIIASIIAILVLGGAGTLTYALSNYNVNSGVHLSKKIKVIPKKPVVIYSTLTGLPVVDASVNQRPVTGVMVENSIDARPQSGLDKAGVVFEAEAEGGVTRFMALYQDSQPSYIGPVRSLRPYYLQWCLSFDCAIAHVGGSPDALNDVTDWNAKNLDQFYNAKAYWRISSRYAPHNVYTDASHLSGIETSKGFGAASYTGWARKADSPSKTPTASSLDFSLSGYYYNPHFDYDLATNSYKRSESGAPHMEVDENGVKTQISPKVVVAMVVPLGQGELDSSGAFYSNYQATGSGQAYIFQDGTVATATWNKLNNNAPILLRDATGKDIALNRGQTWVTAVSTAGRVTYK
jgi:hypothetical protein